MKRQSSISKLFLISSLCLLSITRSSLALGSTIHEKELQEMIEKVMKYEIRPEILKRYQSETNISWERVPKIVEEVKRFLIMGALSTGERAAMLSEEVDELWHTLILFTQDYEKFCKETLGKFIHHIPCSKEEIAARPADHYEKAYNYFSSIYKSIFGITPPDDVWMTPDKCNCSDGGGGSRCGAC